MDNPGLLPIGKAAQMMGVSVDTLRRWERNGKFSAIRSQGAHRYFRKSDVDSYLRDDLFLLAQKWATEKQPSDLAPELYCQNSAVFQTRLTRFERELGAVSKLGDRFSLVVAVAGEIGNNSFDHNIGNWPDMPGIFFGYDVRKGRVVLADRGQGILKTLSRVRQGLVDDRAALEVAFTEIISGRAPEARGNGLKFVRREVTSNPFTLQFQSGNAELFLSRDDRNLQIQTSKTPCRGCIAQLTF